MEEIKRCICSIFVIKRLIFSKLFVTKKKTSLKTKLNKKQKAQFTFFIKYLMFLKAFVN